MIKPSKTPPFPKPNAPHQAASGRLPTQPPTSAPGEDGYVHSPPQILGGHVLLAALDGEEVVEKLAQGVSERLPADATVVPLHRERIVSRAAQFENEVKALAASQFAATGSIQQLRGALPARFASDAPIELHGVASHFLPETLQAHVSDRQGKVTVFLRDSQGVWVEHALLTERVRGGLLPTMAPGMMTKSPGTMTFAKARLLPNGGIEFRIPPLHTFSHQPRARPFQVGDVVQVPRSTGKTLVRTEGLEFVPAEEIQFATVRATNGRGEWTLELLGAEGQILVDEQGQPRQQTITDAELREINNPTLLRHGDSLYKISVDTESASHKAWIAEFTAHPDIQKLLRERPGPDATPEVMAQWEKTAAETADQYLDAKMTYPTELQSVQRFDERIEYLKTRIEEVRKAPPPTRPSNVSSLRWDMFKPPTVESLQNDIETIRKVKERTVQHYDFDSKGAAISDFAQNGLGECRHQAIAMQILMQQLGIDSRMTRGQALNAAGIYRGEHMWLEGQFSDGTAWMIDPTWSSGRPSLSRLQPIYLKLGDRQEHPTDSKSDYRQQVTR